MQLTLPRKYSNLADANVLIREQVQVVVHVADIQRSGTDGIWVRILAPVQTHR